MLTRKLGFARSDGKGISVLSNVAAGSLIMADESRSYSGLSATGLYRHETVTHSKGQYVSGQAYTNSAESFWAIFKRGIYGTYHHLSEKHLARYLNEFTARHNIRPLDTIDQMKFVVRQMQHKRLTYKDFTAKQQKSFSASARSLAQNNLDSKESPSRKP